MELWRLSRSVLCLCALLVAGSSALDCVNAPAWLFSLPEDLEPIYSGLTEPFVIVMDGEVTAILTDANAVGLFAISSAIPEFPLVWCSTGNERVNYSLGFTSQDPSVLRDSLVSVPYQGVLSNNPYRFHACFPCVNEGLPTTTKVIATLNLSRPNGVEYCSLQFFFSKTCNSQSDDYEVCNESDLFQDGFINVTGVLDKGNRNTTTPPPPRRRRRSNVGVILSATLVPIAFLALIVGIFIIWLVWYRNRSKVIASFQPEAVSLAYQGVYSALNRREPHEKEFAAEHLSLVRELGEGAFGIVHEAKAQEIEQSGVVSIVAVKQLRGDTDAQIVEDFFREVDFMSRLDHPRVVRLLGVCSQQEPFSMIFEYMDLGDLRSFLRDAAGLGMSEDNGAGVVVDNPLLTTPELLSIAVQVAEGMVYISSKHLVHRDLATRNCLVATGLVVKIADFGMSRDVYSSDYYRVHGNALLPVRWMPPESILYGKFTMQTDIWAFGILLWEVFTFGQQPYTGLQNEEVIKCVEKGAHPEIPPSCPATQLMSSCWRRTPQSRPSFDAICATLQTMIGSFENS